jgi:hypothetical protein
MAEKGERRSPTSHRTPTQMKRKARSKTQNAKPENIAKRSANNQARAKVNASRKAAGKPKLKTTQHVHHKKPLRSGGSNAKSNLQVTSRKANVSKAGGQNQHTKKKRKTKK